jgi:hypothetical protein
MKTKWILGILLFVSVSFSQTENWSGLKEVWNVPTFKADSARYSQTFQMSQYENLRITALADDTSEAGFASDSIAFFYWIETGHPVYNANGKLDTTWMRTSPILIDTFKIDSANCAITYRTLEDEGFYNIPRKKIDTLMVTGFSAQSRNVTPEWDVFYRIGVKGIAGNKVASFIKLRFYSIRRTFSYVRNR